MVTMDEQTELITGMIMFLKRSKATAKKATYLVATDLELTPELDVELACLGMSVVEVSEGCLISWSEDFEAAKNSYYAEEEYKNLRASGPTKE